MTRKNKYWPSYLVLELTSRCNLRCVMCAINDDPRLQKGGEMYGDMDMRIIENLEPFLQNINRVDLNGHGESLLNREFLNMLERVKKKVTYVGLASNALMINDDIARGMVQNKLDELIISIHASDSGLYREISWPGNIKTLLGNIRMVNEYKKKCKKSVPVLKFQFVGMKKNVSQIVELLKLAGEMGVAELTILSLSEYKLVQGESLQHYPELVRKFFPPAIRLAGKLGVKLSIPPQYMKMLRGSAVIHLINRLRLMKLKPSLFGFLRNKAKSIYRSPQKWLGPDARNCLDPWNYCLVLQNGNVRPCCVLEEIMGNLADYTFEEIWFGEKYKTLRESILSNSPPQSCYTCIIRPWTKLSHLKAQVAGKVKQGNILS